LVSSIKGIVFGIVLFLVAFPVLWWNEGRAVKTARMLEEVGGNVKSVSAEKVDKSLEGKLVHVSGKATTAETLKDPEFGVSAKAIKLARRVEMHQWQERSESKTQNKLGGGTETVTTYNYNKAWSDRLVPSSQFKKPEGHQNPAEMPFQAQTWTAKEVMLGAYRLSASLVAQISSFTAVEVAQSVLDSLPENLKKDLKVQGGGLYKGSNPAAPQVGDAKISFVAALPTEVSLIAKRQGNSFVAYVASNGKTFEKLEVGLQSAEQMVQSAKSSNVTTTWILRLVGLVMMTVGLACVFAPLAVVADVIPFLGSIVRMGTGIVAFLMALPLALVTIAVAWIAYRPVLAVGLLVVAGLVVGGILHLRARRKR
jgi:hypothetical protein